MKIGRLKERRECGGEVGEERQRIENGKRRERGDKGENRERWDKRERRGDNFNERKEKGKERIEEKWGERPKWV